MLLLMAVHFFTYNFTINFLHFTAVHIKLLVFNKFVETSFNELRGYIIKKITLQN